MLVKVTMSRREIHRHGGGQEDSGCRFHPLDTALANDLDVRLQAFAHQCPFPGWTRGRRHGGAGRLALRLAPDQADGPLRETRDFANNLDRGLLRPAPALTGDEWRHLRPGAGYTLGASHMLNPA